jgi:hypothetical protein
MPNERQYQASARRLRIKVVVIENSAPANNTLSDAEVLRHWK